ncbi:MAG: hypothetical protein B7Z68_07980 [Acidobacteria bacterium 21-70-11]|nr:MAG: hypothetical protein B7Z68_07980 [Acidobacteria bacterium 21-70-11]
MDAPWRSRLVRPRQPALPRPGPRGRRRVGQRAGGPRPPGCASQRAGVVGGGRAAAGGACAFRPRRRAA